MSFSLHVTRFRRSSLPAPEQLALALLLAAFALVPFLFSGRHLDPAVEQGSVHEASGRIGEAATAAAPQVAMDLRGVVDYVARKYRVAVPAVEVLVEGARASGNGVGLDPLLIIAVMAVESGFNPIAESPMGAQGLMQVIPRFHQDKLDAASGNNGLLDPLVNIQVGALVLKESIRRAGSLESGLQQYAGAVSDDEALYAAKVLAERQRIESAGRRGRQNGA